MEMDEVSENGSRQNSYGKPWPKPIIWDSGKVSKLFNNNMVLS